MAKPWLNNVKALLSPRLAEIIMEPWQATLLPGADQAGSVVGGPINGGDV